MSIRFKVLPWLGDTFAKDAESYRYLAESIRMHPDQETLKTMMEQAGLDRRQILQFVSWRGSFTCRDQILGFQPIDF